VSTPSFQHPSRVLYVPIVLNFVIWTVLGFLLTAAALAKGVRESFQQQQ